MDASLPFHPLADAFPLIEGPEFEELVASVRAQGLFDAITLLNGSILDGRNRYRACLAAGIEPRFENFAGADPVAFVVSKNINRRHMDESQRSIVAARLARLRRGDTASQRSDVEISTSLTQQQAADLLNVSRDLVMRARVVLDRGTPEEISQVEHGQAAVSTVARQIRDGIPPEQRKPRTRDESARNNTKQLHAELWHQLKDALNNIVGMPHPEDALRIVGGGNRAAIISDRLPIALQWLRDFSDEWNRRDV